MIAMPAAPMREFDFSDEDFVFLSALIHEQTGIVLSGHKRDMVYARLARRLRQLRYASFAQYVRLLQSEEGQEEIGPLVNAITTNLTRFFREPHHFDHLRESVLRPLLESGQTRLRLWSAGCSSGAEPYSMAMVAADLLKAHPHCDLKILATDIDTQMLESAAQGIYPQESMEPVPQRYHRYIASHPRGAAISPQAASLVSFRRLNLLEDWPMHGMFDVLFCRNVVIYFDKDTQRRLFDRFADLMPPGAPLYIGHSENLFSVSTRFRLMGKTIYERGPT